VNAALLGAALALGAGVVLGLLGGGGSVLTVPILVYVVGLEPRPAMATSLVVVGVTAVVALVPHARAGRVRFRAGLLFGGAGLVGALAGGQVARLVPGSALMLLLSGVMLAMAAAMLRPRAAGEGAGTGVSGPRSTGLALASGLGVGVLTGLLGTGGGFMVVPALSLLGGFSMGEAVGTSLLVIALNSASGLVGALAAGAEVQPGLAAGMAAAASTGSLLGARLGRGWSAAALKQAFAGLLVVLSVAMGLRELAPVLPLGPWPWAAAFGGLGVAGAWRALRARPATAGVSPR
jgi:uncharacterized membrane protein YfcA